MESNMSGAPWSKLSPERKKAAKRVWARDRSDNIQMVLQFAGEFLLQQYPEHKQCFMEVVQDHAGLLLWIAFGVLVDSEKARDCTTDALEKASRSLQRRSIEAVREMDLKAWLCVCVRRYAQTMGQKENLRMVSLQEAIAAAGSESIVWYPEASANVSEQPEQIVVYEDACKMLITLIFTLPPLQRRAILDHYLREEPYGVVAARYWKPGSEKAANMAVIRGLRYVRHWAEKMNLRFNDFQIESFRGMLTDALLAVPDIQKSVFERDLWGFAWNKALSDRKARSVLVSTSSSGDRVVSYPEVRVLPNDTHRGELL